MESQLRLLPEGAARAKLCQMFAPNIDRKGRALRGALALILFAAAGIAVFRAAGLWLIVILAAAAIFTTFEALRGWCALRACGIKTRH